jgi:16S rRNA (uracil1498-N3)-methyltransferase
LRVLPRFFAPDAGRDAAERLVTLPDDEASHLTRVLRLAPGASVRVFDGAGAEWRAEVAETRRGRASVTLIERVAPAPEAQIAIALAVAVLKGDKMDAVVRDAVMLGATAIQPLITERTEISLAAVERSRRIDRWQRIVVSSAKQCGRAVVPPVLPAQTFDGWIREEAKTTATDVPRLRLVLVEPGAAGAAHDIRRIERPGDCDVIVGPAGGWAEQELAAAEIAGVQRVTLGGLTLRADAAPIVALTALRVAWGDW